MTDDSYLTDCTDFTEVRIAPMPTYPHERVSEWTWVSEFMGRAHLSASPPRSASPLLHLSTSRKPTCFALPPSKIFTYPTISCSSPRTQSLFEGFGGMLGTVTSVLAAFVAGYNLAVGCKSTPGGAQMDEQGEKGGGHAPPGYESEEGGVQLSALASPSASSATSKI